MQTSSHTQCRYTLKCSRSYMFIQILGFLCPFLCTASWSRESKFIYTLKNIQVKWKNGKNLERNEDREMIRPCLYSLRFFFWMLKIGIKVLSYSSITVYKTEISYKTSPSIFIVITLCGLFHENLCITKRWSEEK